MAKNDTAWPAVVQFSLLMVLLPVPVVATVIASGMAVHAAGVPGWALATGTVASAGGAGAMTVSRRRKAEQSGTDQEPGPQGGGSRSSRRQGSHRRR